jgi:signal peptidase I
MDLFILIVIGIILIIASYFISSAVLLWVCKIFKIEQASFKSSLLIGLLIIALGLLAGLLNILLAFLTGLDALIQILALFEGIIIFHFVLQKFYQTKFGKNLAIYIVSGIFIVIFSLVITIPIRYLVIQPFYNVGAGMSPTFTDHDYILIKMYDKNYQREDIVIFRYPKDPGQYFIKRIIGLPGEKVSFSDGNVLINGQALDESEYLGKNIKTESLGINEFILADGQYFVLGDNREASLDSRKFGPISKSSIIGKYWLTLVKNNQQ